jgi:hypothetical protein
MSSRNKREGRYAGCSFYGRHRRIRGQCAFGVTTIGACLAVAQKQNRRSHCITKTYFWDGKELTQEEFNDQS